MHSNNKQSKIYMKLNGVITSRAEAIITMNKIVDLLLMHADTRERVVQIGNVLDNMLSEIKARLREYDESE